MLHHGSKAADRPHRQCVVMTKHITDEVFTISCLDRKVKPPVDFCVNICGDV